MARITRSNIIDLIIYYYLSSMFSYLKVVETKFLVCQTNQFEEKAKLQLSWLNSLIEEDETWCKTLNVP